MGLDRTEDYGRCMIGKCKTRWRARFYGEVVGWVHDHFLCADGETKDHTFPSSTKVWFPESMLRTFSELEQELMEGTKRPGQLFSFWSKYKEVVMIFESKLDEDKWKSLALGWKMEQMEN